MKQETFASLIDKFEHNYDQRTVFDDFLTMAICSFGRNPITGLSYDEELYLQTVAKYSNSELRHLFPKLLAHLSEEMENRFGSSEGYDVLGEFFENSISRKGSGQFFTPWHVCVFMAQTTCEQAKETVKDGLDRPLRILDPSCGSGRTLMAANRIIGKNHEYYGIDIDPTCSKMAILNMFLSGMFRSEVMHGDALRPDDFRSGYRSSFLPFGIFRIQQREQSRLWQSQRGLWDTSKSERQKENESKTANGDGSQLQMF